MKDRVTLDDFNTIPDMTIMPEDLNGVGELIENTWQPINLGDLENKPALQPTLGGVGIVYPGKRHVFSGPQESAKTLAAYAISIETIRTGGTVIVIDFEMGRWDARDRLTELGATRDELRLIYYVEPAEPATPERIQPLVDLEPLLVVIDAAAGAYDLQGLDDNKRQDVERFTRLYVRDFWRANIATIVLDHVVKNADNRGNYAIGSERKVGGADVHLGFEAVVPINRGSTGIYKITTRKDRGGWLARGRLADLHLTSDPADHHISWEFKEAEHTEGAEPWRPWKMMERVSEYLQTQEDELAFDHVLTNVKGRDSVLKDALEHLIALQYVTETAGARGARMVRSERLYKHDDTTSADVCPPLPGRPPPTSARSAPPYRGQAERAEHEADPTSAAEIDVYDPAVQAFLDYDSDIPF